MSQTCNFFSKIRILTIKMSDSDECELQIAIRSQETDLPNNFRFTVFEEVVPGRLFEDPSSFGIMRLWAAGTREGPIVLFKLTACCVEFVCLCCAHAAEITDIKQLGARSSRFVSADCDGNVCVWSNVDGSCERILRKAAQPGEVRFTDASEPDCVVVWTRGFDAKVVRLKDGSVVRSLNKFGLSGFAFVTPEKCCLAQKPTFVAVKFGSVQVFDPEFGKLGAFPIHGKWDEVVHVSEYGIVKTEGVAWKLLAPTTFVECADGKIKGAAQGDRIADVRWMDSKLLCVGTFMSKFMVVNIRFTTVLDQPVVHVDQTLVLDGSRADLTTRFLFSSNKIIHTTAKGTIEAISVNGKRMCSSKVRPCSLAYVSKESNGVILKTAGTHKVLAMPISGSSWEEFDIPARVTALTCVTSVSSSPEIFVGTEDGQVLCYELGASSHKQSCLVFSDQVVGLTRMKAWAEKGELLVAIGAEGTIAVLRHVTVLMVYASNDFPLKRLYQDAEGRLLGAVRMDGSVVTFSDKSPGPRLHSSIIPRDWKLIWASSSVGSDRNCRLMVSMGGNVLHFARIDVRGLLKKAKRDVFEPIISGIKDIFGESTPTVDTSMPFVKSHSVNFEDGAQPRALPRSHSIESLLRLDKDAKTKMKTSLAEFECDVRSGDLSFVLLGDQGMPTFFYRDFKLNGMKICYASQRIATVHYIIKALISGQQLECLDAEDLLL